MTCFFLSSDWLFSSQHWDLWVTAEDCRTKSKQNQKWKFKETVSIFLGHVKDLDVMQFLVEIHCESAKPNYKCTLCGKISKSKWNMQRHMVLLHTKPTNDVCQYCSKVFKHKYYLDEHIRTRECLSKMLFTAPSSHDHRGPSSSSMYE